MPLRKSRPGAELGLRAEQRANTVESLGAGMLHSGRKGQRGPQHWSSWWPELARGPRGLPTRVAGQALIQGMGQPQERQHPVSDIAQ